MGIFKNIRTATIFFLVILISSCTEKIDLKVPGSYTRLVVDGSISTDTIIQVVKLSKSEDYYATQSPPPVTGATVTISDGTNIFLLQEKPQLSGTYETTTKVAGIRGKTYTLTINNVDINDDGVLEEYSALSELKPVIPADSIQIAREKQPGVIDTGWVVKVYAKNVPGEAWFLFKVKKNQTNLTDSAHKFTALGYSDGSEAYINGSAVFVSDGTITEEKIHDGDTITLEALGITKEYYQFLTDFVAEYYPKSPIGSGPSANISTNVGPKDKAAGFFSAYSITRISTIYHASKK